MHIEQLQVVGLYCGEHSEVITKSACQSITLDWDGVGGDARHRGDRRGTGGYTRKWSACVGNEIEQLRLNWNASLAQSGSPFQVSRIDPSWLGANILFSDRENFSTFYPHVFKFPSGLVLYASMTNQPCIYAGLNILRQLYEDRPEEELKSAAALFPKASRSLRGIVGGVVPENYGSINIGDMVSCYS